MKKLVNALTGKKAMYTVLALTIIGSVLEIVTAIRMDGAYSIDWTAQGIIYCVIAVWAAGLEMKEKAKEA